MNYVKQVEIRWSDLDPNFHLRHSAYYDFGAYCRIAFLNEHGITPAVMIHHSIGPVLFREECIFKKEIKFSDRITIDLKLDKVSADYRKWTMVHQIMKHDETLAAVITIDGAWMSTALRKLIKPPEMFRYAFEQLPKTENFRFA